MLTACDLKVFVAFIYGTAVTYSLIIMCILCACVMCAQTAHMCVRISMCMCVCAVVHKQMLYI